MKRSDTIEIRRLAVAKEVNTLNRIEERSDDQEKRFEELLNENDKLLSDKLLAIRAESLEPETETRDEHIDVKPEDREWSHLANEIEFRHYVSSTIQERKLTGREAEVRQEMGLKDNQVPYEALLPRTEHRAAPDATAAPSATGQQQTSIIERVFADTIAVSGLGVNMPSVPTGSPLYPIISAGVTAQQLAKDADTSSTAGTIQSFTLKPVRMSAQYTMRVEDVAVLAGLEAALRSDGRNALGDLLDKQVLMGSGTAPQVSGFLSELPAPSGGDVAGAAVDTFADFIKKTSSAIDGKHAAELANLSTVMGVQSYIVAANAFHTTGDALSAQSYLNQNTAGVKSSANMKAVASHKQNGIVYRNRVGNNAFAPVWQGFELWRDPYTAAGRGMVLLTFVMLYNFKIIREAAYKRVEYRVST